MKKINLFLQTDVTLRLEPAVNVNAGGYSGWTFLGTLIVLQVTNYCCATVLTLC